MTMSAILESSFGGHETVNKANGAKEPVWKKFASFCEIDLTNLKRYSCFVETWDAQHREGGLWP
jgi:hypothetical protein